MNRWKPTGKCRHVAVIYGDPFWDVLVIVSGKGLFVVYVCVNHDIMLICSI